MTSLKVKLSKIISSLILSASLSLVFVSGGDLEPTLKKGDKAPLFMVQDLKYNKFTLSSVLEDAKENNDLVIFDFFATWCVPCKKEFPVFEKVYKELEEKGVKFYAISIDADRKALWKFIKADTKVTFPVLYDANAFNAGKKYGADKVLPQLFIIDSKGTVQFSHVGEILNLEEVLKSEIEKIKPGSFPEYKDVKAKTGESAAKE